MTPPWRLSFRYKAQLEWNRGDLPREMADYLEELRSSRCAACGALAIKSHSETKTPGKFNTTCLYDATELGIVFVDTPGWSTEAMGTKDTPADLTLQLLRGLQGFVVVFDISTTSHLNAEMYASEDGDSIEEAMRSVRAVVSVCEARGTTPAPPIAVVANMADKCAEAHEPTKERLQVLEAMFRRVVLNSSAFGEDDFSFHSGSGRRKDATLATQAVGAIASRLAVVDRWDPVRLAARKQLQQQNAVAMRHLIAQVHDFEEENIMRGQIGYLHPPLTRFQRGCKCAVM